MRILLRRTKIAPATIVELESQHERVISRRRCSSAEKLEKRTWKNKAFHDHETTRKSRKGFHTGAFLLPKERHF